MVVATTGSKAFEGSQQTAAARMAVDEVNAAGGINGMTLQLIVQDSQAKPSEGVSVAEKLITQDKVSVLLSSDTSSVVKAVAPVGQKYGIPMIATTATAPDITDMNNTFMFRTIPHDGMLSASFADFIMKQPGVKKVGFLLRNDDWGRQSGALLKAEFEKRGAIVPSLEYFQQGDASFLVQTTKIKNQGVDAVVILALAADAAVQMKEFNELGFKGIISGLGSLAADQYIKMAGKYAENNYCANQYVYTIDNTLNKTFVTSYMKANPNLPFPDKNAWGEYTAVKAFAEAIKIAKSDKPDKIRDALTKVKFEGITGEIAFDAKLQAHPNIYITVNKAGKPEVLAAVPTK